MKTQNAPPLWFFLLVGIAIGKRLAFHPSGNTFTDSYLLDLLCIPIVMEGCKWILEKSLKRQYRFTGYHVFVAVLYFSLVFEWILPGLSKRYHSDIYDVVCYGTSAAMWYAIHLKLNFKRQWLPSKK
jgi:hypothetical protein